MAYNLPFCFLFENVRGTVVRQVPNTDNLNYKPKLVGYGTFAKMYNNYKENRWQSVAFMTYGANEGQISLCECTI